MVFGGDRALAGIAAEHEDHPYDAAVQGCELCEWEQQPLIPDLTI